MNHTTLLLTALALLPFQTKNPAVSAVVKQKAREISQAVVKGDGARVADLTYPKIVEMMGGRAKVISSIEAIMNQMKKDGFALKSNTIGEPSATYSEGVNTFIVVPTAMELTAPGGQVTTKSYLLGISSDKGKSWKFVDGNALGNVSMREKVLPKLPAKLKLPEKQAPVFKKSG